MAILFQAFCIKVACEKWTIPLETRNNTIMRARSYYIIDPRHSKDHIHTSLVITIAIDSVMCLVASCWSVDSNNCCVSDIGGSP